MLKFVIVDDEPLALESFAELLDWEKYGFSLAGCAANGAQALQLVQDKQPEIVFTDIRMPIMDGLELCRRLHEEHPDVKVVILTAYRDFDYARRALSYGVTEYLLKNQIEPETVLPLLKRMQEEIEQERRRKEAQKHHYYQSMMLNMVPPDTQAPGGKNRPCCCMLVQCRRPYIAEHLGIAPMPDVSLRKKEAEALLPPDSPLIVQQLIWLDARSWGILLAERGRDVLDFSRLEKPLREFWDALQSDFQKRHSLSLFALFDVSAGTPERLKETFDELLAFSQYSPFIAKTEVCLYHRLPYQFRNTDEKHGEIRRIAQKVIEAVERADDCAVQEQMRRLKCEFTTPCCDLGKFRYICGHLLEQMDGLLERNSLPPLKEYMRQTRQGAVELLSAEEIWNWLVKEFCQLEGLSKPGKRTPKNRKIEQALEYIHKNYQHRLTARQVGEQIGLSEVYFSNLFKKETGVTFGEYLTNYRIGVAKYLIQNGDYKIYEIAERTGYASPQYFSQIFQKETGQTPLEYKTYGDTNQGR